eukprot:g4416.t1
MRTTICSLVILSLIIQMTNAAIGSSSKFRPRTNLKCESPKCPKEDDGLDLTETIKKLGVEKARELSEVSDLGNITSYSGFFTTSEIPAGNKNKMFYWYFPAQNGDKDAPLLVWLQGGPGGSSMFGLFAEMGPFTLLGPNGPIELKESSWNKRYQMIFIDNPVGAGFSSPSSPNGYCNNTKECVASNLYSLLQQFYVLFPDLMNNDLFITGESYGGHYVPGISYYIHEHNNDLKKCNGPTLLNTPCQVLPFKGFAVGDGWIDPVNQMNGYPGLLYNFGMVDDQELEQVNQYCDSTIDLIKQNEMKKAFDVWDEFLNGDVYPYPSFYKNVTGSYDYDNMLRTYAPDSFSYFGTYLNQPDVREKIHVGNSVFNNGHECEMHLLSDFHVSFADEMTVLLNSNKYNIILYSGQLDIIIGAPLTEAFLKVLDWDGKDKYLSSKKIIWRVDPSDKQVAGYVKTVGKFSYAIVRGAGHIAPYDQPRPMNDLIDKLVSGEPFKP